MTNPGNIMQKVTLETLANGAVPELFQRELDEVLKNIADVNTAPDAARSITIKIKFKPSKQRDMSAVEIHCKAELPGAEPASAALFFGKESGKLAAFQNDPQLGLNLAGDTGLQVVANIERKTT